MDRNLESSLMEWLQTCYHDHPGFKATDEVRVNLVRILHAEEMRALNLSLENKKLWHKLLTINERETIQSLTSETEA